MPTPHGSRVPSRALLYATFNGAANCTNGIGRQTQTLLGALHRRWTELTDRTGPFTPYLAIPTPGPTTWAYDPDQLATTRHIIESRGGRVIHLDHDTTAPFWTPPVWQQLSHGAARAARTLAAHHEHVVLIAVDTPYLGAGAALLELEPAHRSGRVEVVLTLYGTARLRNPDHPDPDQLRWEHDGLAAAHQPNVRVADIGDAFTRHLCDAYDVDPAGLVPYRCSLDLTAPDLQPMPPADATRVASAF